MEFELRLPKTTSAADLKREAQVELFPTDQNQTLASIDNSLLAMERRPRRAARFGSAEILIAERMVRARPASAARLQAAAPRQPEPVG